MPGRTEINATYERSVLGRTERSVLGREVSVSSLSIPQLSDKLKKQRVRTTEAPSSPSDLSQL